MTNTQHRIAGSHIISLNPPTWSLSITGRWNVSLPSGVLPWNSIFRPGRGVKILHYSISRIAPLYPWSSPYSAECKARQYQVPFLSLWYCYILTLRPGLKMPFLGNTPEGSDTFQRPLVMQRKRVTSELHDSYFRLMTIEHPIQRSSRRSCGRWVII